MVTGTIDEIKTFTTETGARVAEVGGEIKEIVIATAADITSAITEVNQTGGATALSLAHGTNGQIKTFIAIGTGSNNIVITPTNLRGASTITLNAEGETVQCLFKNSKWNVIGGHDFVVA